MEEARGFITENKAKPFFLCYAPNLVHRPLQAREEDIAKFEKREKEEARHDPVYAAMVEMVDRVFQGMLDTLEAEGLSENTVIVFTSDNGINGRVGDATPLRGEKGSCYEGGIRVPTMVYWPGVTKAQRTASLVDIVDWYPTLVEISGAEKPKHELDGVSMLSVLNGTRPSVRESVPLHMPCYNGKPGHPGIWQTPFSTIHDWPAWVMDNAITLHVYPPHSETQSACLEGLDGESLGCPSIIQRVVSYKN